MAARGVQCAFILTVLQTMPVLEEDQRSIRMRSGFVEGLVRMALALLV